MPRSASTGLARRVSAALAVVLTWPASGQLVCYEGFGQYNTNVQLESGLNNEEGTGRNGGTGWGGAYDVSNPIKMSVKIEDRSGVGSSLPNVSYTQGALSIPGGNRALRFWDSANGSYAVRRPIGSVFHAAQGQDLWFGILFRTATGGGSPLADPELFQIGFDDNPSPALGIPRVGIGSGPLSEEVFPAACHFFAGSSADPLNRAFHESLPVAAATTYLLVGQIQAAGGAYDTVNLFVNPTGLDQPGPPSATITAPSGLSTLSHAFIRTAGLDQGDAYVLDEWRIGRDYASVVGSLDKLLELLPAASPGGSLTLRWPALMPGVVLESSATLAADSWTVVAGPFTQSAGYSILPVAVAPENPRRFFRLRR